MDRQLVAFSYDRKPADVVGGRAEQLFALIIIGRFVDAAALDGGGSGYRVQTAMAEMRAAIVKGADFTLLIGHDQQALRQIVPFDPDGAKRLLELWGFGKVDVQPSIRVLPA